MTVISDELFDISEYEVPFPKADGHPVTDLAVRFGGNILMNRNDPEHAQLVESLTLGKRILITANVVVAGKSTSIREDGDGNEFVTHNVVLRTEMFNPA